MNFLTNRVSLPILEMPSIKAMFTLLLLQVAKNLISFIGIITEKPNHRKTQHNFSPPDLGGLFILSGVFFTLKHLQKPLYMLQST